MKNHELIANVGGIEKAREIVGGAPENTQMIIPCLDGGMYFSKRGDGKWFKWSDGYSQWLEYFGSTNPMDLAVSLSDLRTAIAEHDAPEFKVGDAIVYIDSFMHDEIGVVSKVDDRVWFNRGAAVCEFDMVRHATPSEIVAGHRIESNTDDVADIGYHVSPLTKVSCHHQWVNEDVMGGTEHHYFCAYCGEEKTEAFGSCDHDWEDVTKPEKTERHLVCTYCNEVRIQDMAIDAERWGES